MTEANCDSDRKTVAGGHQLDAVLEGVHLDRRAVLAGLMMIGPTVIVAAVVVVFVLIVGFSSVRLVPQARVVNVQRLARYLKTAGSGPVFVIPFVDQILPTIDLREQVVPFDPQSVITSDNVGIQVATVVYYQIIDPKSSAYAVVNLVAAMEKQMQAEREKRAAVLRAEGEKQAAVLQAEGNEQAAILTAEGRRQSSILQAEGDARALVTVQKAQAEAIEVVFAALTTFHATPEILKYLYVQALPKMAQGTANTLFVVPSELQNIASLGATFSAVGGRNGRATPQTRTSAAQASDGAIS